MFHVIKDISWQRDLDRSTFIFVGIVSLALLYFLLLAVNVRRIHDIGKKHGLVVFLFVLSYFLTTIIPIVFYIYGRNSDCIFGTGLAIGFYFFALGCRKGQEGNNQYGPDPKRNFSSPASSSIAKQPLAQPTQDTAKGKPPWAIFGIAVIVVGLIIAVVYAGSARSIAVEKWVSKTTSVSEPYTGRRIPESTARELAKDFNVGEEESKAAKKLIIIAFLIGIPALIWLASRKRKAASPYSPAPVNNPLPRQPSPEVDALLRRAFIVMEDGDWEKADDLLEQALNREPENPRAYLGKALANLQIPTEAILKNRLATDGISFLTNNKDYQKALRFADYQYRAALLGYHPELQRYGIYEESAAAMDSATSAEQFKFLADTFASISGYRDANALAEECKYQQALAEMKTAKTADQFEALANAFLRAKGLKNADVLAEECRKESIYLRACNEMDCYFELAAKLFASIHGYKDADALAEKCRELEMEDRKNFKRWLIVIFAMVGILAAVVWYYFRYAEIAARNKITVYVTGYKKSYDGTRIATLWTDGKATELATGDSIGEAVFVVGKNVFVAGGEKNSDGINIAKIWKNGTAQNLTNGNFDAFANAIYVDGANVYAAGREKNAGDKQRAALWKNGSVQYLSNGLTDAIARSVFVSGGNVYVAGYEKEGNDRHVAVLWKNGNPQRLSELKSNRAWALSVFVQDDDVYVAGFEMNKQGKAVATLWINGIAYDLSDGSREAVAQSVTVSNGNVYVVGQVDYEGQPTVAKLWINGVEQNVSSGVNSAYANSVCVLNGEVYVAGRQTRENDKKITEALLWKNGYRQTLERSWNDADARASSVSVTKGSDGDTLLTTGSKPTMKIAPRGGTVEPSPTSETPSINPRASSVSDMTYSRAEEAIISAGLKVGQVTRESHDTVPLGIVIGSKPRAGTAATRGMSVDVIWSTGPSSSAQRRR